MNRLPTMISALLFCLLGTTSATAETLKSKSQCTSSVRAVLASGGEEGINGQRSIDAQAMWAQRLAELYGDAEKIVIISFAVDFYGQKDVNEYLEQLKAFKLFEGKELVLLRDFNTDSRMARAAENADAFFTLGGNTFKLVHDLHTIRANRGPLKPSLMDIIRQKVESGIPYAGVSAGSNIAAPTMMTTNDMPIIFPPSFKTLGIVPFQINPHFVSGTAYHRGPDGELHPYGGETREIRINEFHLVNSVPVVAIPELSLLVVKGDEVVFEAADSESRARLFLPNREVQLLAPGTNITAILKPQIP